MYSVREKDREGGREGGRKRERARGVRGRGGGAGNGLNSLIVSVVSQHQLRTKKHCSILMDKAAVECEWSDVGSATLSYCSNPACKSRINIATKSLAS